MEVRLVAAFGVVLATLAPLVVAADAGADGTTPLDAAAPVLWDSETGHRAGGRADRFELDDPRAGGLSTWYRLSYVVGSDRLQVDDHSPATTTATDADIAKSELVAWRVAASISGAAGPGQLPEWARPRTGADDGTSAGLLFSLADLDLLTTGALAGRLRIAATGSIGSDGSVTAVRMVDAKLAAARLAAADVVFAPDFPTGHGPVIHVPSHGGQPTPERTIGDWLGTAGYEAAGRAATASTGPALVQVDDVRQALAWLCGRTALPTTCTLARSAAARPSPSLAPVSDPSLNRRPGRSWAMAPFIDSSDLIVGEQAVVHGEQARHDAARGAGLGVDVLDVVAGRLRRDHQARRDLLARQAAGE